MAEPYRIMLKQVAYNVFIGPLAVPILFEPQHGLLKTGFLPRIPPTSLGSAVPTPHTAPVTQALAPPFIGTQGLRRPVGMGSGTVVRSNIFFNEF